LSRKEWVKDGINVFSNGLNHKDLSILHSHLNFLQPLLLGKLNRYHLTSFSSFDPFLTLELWIDEQWVSGA
jgi:hypothetical protein